MSEWCEFKQARLCGPPVKAQATARVDVPTARVFPVWTKESNTCTSFLLANAWICAQRATDRDLESLFANAWICAQRATDRDLETKKSECLDMHLSGNRL